MDIRVVVGASHAALFSTLIKRELKMLRVRGMRVHYREKPEGFFRCRMTESRFFGRVDRKGFKKAVANSVSGLIIARWEQYFGRELIRQSEWTGEGLDWGEICVRLNKNRALIRKLRRDVYKIVVRCLDESARLDVIGLVRFRLADVLDSMIDALTQVIDEQLFEQENEEFIEVLKNYTARRKRHPDTVHVVVQAASRFRLYDENFEDLTSDPAHEVPLLDDEVRNEDLLIASLLTLAPKQIVLHGKRCLPVTRDTLHRVFGPAVSVCRGCNRCAVWVKA